MTGRTENSLRRRTIETCLGMNRLGINQGVAGNVSARYGDGLLITPSGLPYDEMRPADIVYLDENGRPSGEGIPSSEWRFHYDILRQRSDAGVVESRRADDCVKVPAPPGGQVVHDHVGSGEFHDHVGRGDVIRIRDDRDAANFLPSRHRIEGRNERQIIGGDDRLANQPTHSPRGARHRNTNHATAASSSPSSKGPTAPMTYGPA